MTRVGSSAPVIPISFQLDEFAKSGSSFFSKFNFNWEKGILVSNVGLLVAGIAYGFFMRLPLMMASLAVYGLFYLSLYGKVKNSRPSSGKLYQLQAQLDVEEEQNRKVSRKLEANLRGRDLVDNLRMQVKEDQLQLDQLEQRNRSLRSVVGRLKDRRDELLGRRGA